MTRLVVVSDLHVGSLYGIMPPSFERMDGNRIEANKTQVEIYEHWKEMCSAWKNPDFVVVNGDAIDGLSPAAFGREVWSTDLSEQIDAATQLLEMLHGKEYRFTIGSQYHVESPGWRAEQTLAKNFGTDAKMQLHMSIGEQNIHFSHAIGVSMGLYRSTAIAKELAINLLNLKALNDYHWVFRSHAHYYVAVSYKTHTGVVTPAWQGQTAYMVRKSPFGMIPDIGALRLSGNGTPLKFERMIWRQARPELEKLE